MTGLDDSGNELDRPRQRTRRFFWNLLIVLLVFAFGYALRSLGPST